MNTYTVYMSKIKRLCHEINITGWTVNPEYTELIVSDSLRFSIPEYYPFKPPILWIDGLPHEHYLKQHYNQLLPIIQLRKYKIHCICCSTILCSWSPCFQCVDVYNEYTAYLQSLHYVDSLEKLGSYFDSLIIDKISTFLL